MHLAQVLDVIEGPLAASRHPGIVEIRRYGADTAPGGQSPAGIAVRWEYGATSFLWGAVWPKPGTPLPTPEELPPPLPKLARLPVFVVQLLDVAQPPQLQRWTLVALPDIGPTDSRGTVPAAVSVVDADGKQHLLRATYGSGQTGTEPESDPHPEYRIPSEVQEWHLKADAAPAGHS